MVRQLSENERDGRKVKAERETSPGFSLLPASQRVAASGHQGVAHERSHTPAPSTLSRRSARTASSERTVAEGPSRVKPTE